MPKQIYNEGRVVGLSSYEIFIKEFYANGGDPNALPSESEWLASTLTLGSSLLLKFPTVTLPVGNKNADTVIDIPLPSGCQLCAANTIIASFFNGAGNEDAAVTPYCASSATIGSAYWAQRVVDYGELISNTSSSSPQHSATTVNPYAEVPHKSSIVWSSTQGDQLLGYLHLVDGLVIQNGDWFPDTTAPVVNTPYKDLKPDLDSPGWIRFHVHEEIAESFWILLTGFALKMVVSGESGLDGSKETAHSADGDFLGPAVYPWANKVILTVPTVAVLDMLAGSSNVSVTRTVDPLPGETDESQTAVIQNPVLVDLQYPASPGLNAQWADSQIGVSISGAPASGVSFLCLYPRNQTSGLRGLYAATVNSNGEITMDPVECYAPGSVRLFHCPADANTNYATLIARLCAGIPNASTILFGGVNTSLGLDAAGRVYRIYTGSMLTDIDDPPAGKDWISIAEGQIIDTDNIINLTSKYALNPLFNHESLYRANIITGEREINTVPLSKVNASTHKYESAPLDGRSGNTIRSAYDLAYDVTSNSASFAKQDLTWEILLAALCNNRPIDVLGPRMKQLRQSMVHSFGTISGQSKQYALGCRNGAVELQEIASQLPGFFYHSIILTPNNGAGNNPYTAMQLDVFGFSSQNSVVNTFATLSVEGAGRDVSGHNWFQKFKVASTTSNLAEFNALAANLGEVTQNGQPTGDSPSIIKVVCMPNAAYSASSNINWGVPYDNPNYWQAYINLKDGTTLQGNRGDGILYVKNGGRSGSTASNSIMCALTAYTPSYRPSCARDDSGYYWSI